MEVIWGENRITVPAPRLYMRDEYGYICTARMTVCKRFGGTAGIFEVTVKSACKFWIATHTLTGTISMYETDISEMMTQG